MLSEEFKDSVKRLAGNRAVEPGTADMSPRVRRLVKASKEVICVSRTSQGNDSLIVDELVQATAAFDVE